MKKKFILLPLCLLVLGACAPETNEQTNTPSEGTESTQTTVPLAPDDGKVYRVIEDDPEFNKVYKLGMYQANLNKELFALSTFDSDGYRFTTSEKAYQGADFTVEDAGEGLYWLTITPYQGKKTYVNLDYNTHHIVYGDHITKWDWDSKNETLFAKAKIKETEDKTDDYFLGGMKQFDTISACGKFFIKSNFVGHFYEGVQGTPATDLTVTLSHEKLYKGNSIFVRTQLVPSNGTGTISLSIDDDAKSKGITLTNGELKATKDATATKVTLTAKVGTIVKTVEIPVVAANYGTKEAPIKVSEARDLLDAFGGEIEKETFITGVVTSNTAKEQATFGEENVDVFKEVWLAHDTDAKNTKAFELYNTRFDSKITTTGKDALAGQTVVVQAAGMKIFGGSTYETSGKTTILSAVAPAVKPAATGIEVDETGEVRSNEPLTIEAKLTPAGSEGEVEFALKEAVTGIAVSAEGVVTAEPTVAANTTAVVKVTLKDVEPAVVKEVTVTVKAALNLGTAEAPIDAAAFMTSIDTQTKDRLSTVKYYLKGIVGHNYKVGDDGVQSVYITDGNYAKKIYIKATYKDNIGADYTEEGTLYGKEITVEGYGKWYESRGYHNYKLENAVVTSIADPAEPIVATAIELQTSYTISTGETLQLAPTFKPCGANPAVTYTVTGNEKVTVSETGLVTVAADATAADATITAKVSDSVQTTATIKVDVKLPGQKNVVWNIADEVSTHTKEDLFTGKTIDGVTITCPQAKWWDADLRMYNGNIITFSGNGVKILKVIIEGKTISGEPGNANTEFVSNENGKLIISCKTVGGDAELAWKKTCAKGGPMTKITIVTVPAE